jgi:hypothetical protein
MGRGLVLAGFKLCLSTCDDGKQGKGGASECAVQGTSKCVENRAREMLVNVLFKGLAGTWVSCKAQQLGCLAINIGVKVVAVVPKIVLTCVP